MPQKQEIIFVTGKGGVGKSITAAAIAEKHALLGKKTLLVELSDHSFFQDFFGLSQIQYNGVKGPLGFDLALWTGKEALRDYVQHLVKVPKLADLFFENQVSRTLIQVAPALQELAILGKITSAMRHHGPSADAEIIVVDAFATGHFLNLMSAPGSLARAIPFGPMGEQCRGIQATLKDSSIVSYYIVTLPEELPVTECEELCDRLKSDFQIAPKIILNKVFDFPEDTENLVNSEFEKYVAYKASEQKKYLARLKGRDDQVQTLPFILEENPVALITQLAGRLHAV